MDDKKLVKNLEEENINLKDKVEILTKEVENANKILKDLYIEKSKYMGKIAHDLRNPISAIQSFSGLIRDEFDEFPKEKIKKFVGIIYERGEHALKMIENYLVESKLEAGNFILELYPFDYVRFLESVIEKNRIKASEKSQKIHFETAKSKLKIQFDRDKMELVFTNIFNTAIQHSSPDKNIWVEILANDKYVITRITDEGTKISENELIKIFNPYIISSNILKPGEKSQEYNLAIVKKIIDAHNGKFSVENANKNGNVYSISLPLNI